MSKYGTCECGRDMEPVWFLEHERTRDGIETGRVRDAVGHLVCPGCGKVECVNDSFDGPWRKR